MKNALKTLGITFAVNNRGDMDVAVKNQRSLRLQTVGLSKLLLILLAWMLIGLTGCDNGTGGGGNKGGTGGNGGNTPTTFTVTYNGNGNTGGTVPTDSNSPYQNGAKVTVLGNTGNLVKTNNTFSGWNTKADGTGTTYTQGSEFNISANTILYAKWLSDTQGGGNNTLSGNVTINGTPTTGTLLTAVYSGSESVTYQWKRGSANVETGTLFRPLKSGELTVTVSATGYESKSETVTVTGSDTNMFWWGNYIPVQGTHNANVDTVGNPVFNLNELVANVDNARIRRALQAGLPTNENNVILNQDGTIYGVYTSAGVYQGNTTTKTVPGTGTIRWQEYKFSGLTTGSRSFTYSSNQGFTYFISPVSLGSVTIKKSLGSIVYPSSPNFDMWRRETQNIDSVAYYIHYILQPTLAPPTGANPAAQYTFEFPN